MNSKAMKTLNEAKQEAPMTAKAMKTLKEAKKKAPMNAKAMKTLKEAKKKHPMPPRRRLSRAEKGFEDAHLKVVDACQLCQQAYQLLDDALMAL